MTNYRNFKLNSNKSIDHVIFSHDGTLSLDGGYGTLSITHGLSFTPLPFGLFSTDGGTTWSDIDFQTQNGFGQLSASSTTIELTMNFYTSAPSSVKVRIFAFAPSTASIVRVAPPTPLSKFYLDSRKNYDMLLAAGKTTVNSSTSAQTLYTHNLGYRPRVMIWTEENGIVSRPYQWAKVGATGYTNYQYPIIDDSKLAFKNYDSMSGAPMIIHWRLYGSEKA